MARTGQRNVDDIREVKITRDYIKHAEGSVLMELGETKVICTATVEDGVPMFLQEEGQGWITAEYSMLPRATKQRNTREISKGKIRGRTHEIQRLIGRSLRSVVNLNSLGERTVIVDCDVVQADGGTRTASITGSFVALVDALNNLIRKEQLLTMPITDYLAAISVGKVEGKILLDLCFEEDVNAEADMNVVITGENEIVEVQVTAEKCPFSRSELDQMLSYAEKGIKELVDIQHHILGEMKLVE